MSTSNRVTEYAIQSNGARSFGVEVNGIRVLVTADEGRHFDGRALAEAISGLGPEQSPVTEAPAPIVVQRPAKASTEAFRVGQRIWCRVHGAQGYCTVTEVGTGRNRGRIKITGERCWCPAGNFLPSNPRDSE